MRAALIGLVAVDEAGSLTAAAARLHLSQPALTRQIQRLSAEVGVALCAHDGRRTVLTPAGLSLAAVARRHRDDWEAALAAVRGQVRPPLRLGCGTTIALTLLPAALRRLAAAQPELAFRIHAGDSASTATRLLAGEIDAGLATTAPADRRLLALPIVRDPVLAVHPPADPAARLTLRALAEGPLCLYARGTGFRQFVDELFASAGLHPRPVAEMDSLEALRELVAAGLGRSLLPRSVAAAAIAAGRLHALEVPELGGAFRTIVLLRRADLPPHAAFPDLAAALLEAGRALDAEAPAGSAPSTDRPGRPGPGRSAG
jgi:DNA-binding transcriptional LysR family regulator